MRFDAVVVGLGYVGLPLARAAVSAGLSIAGLDVSSAVIGGLRSGRSHVDDVSDSAVAEMLQNGFFPTESPTVVSEADVVVVCVPTPLGDSGSPDLTAVKAAAYQVAGQLRSGTLVILESTTYPGSTEQDLLPILEESGKVGGVDFSLAFSPERVDPGNGAYGIENTPKIVGGLTQRCGMRAAGFYRRFVADVVMARGVREAEMAKLLENTYRHVNIALVNELAKVCHEMGIDIWDVIRCAATKPFGFQRFLPGPGVGGHCIPIDPNYLNYKVHADLGYRFRFVELAQEINSGMPAYVVERASRLLNHEQIALSGSRILLLGVTYKHDISDMRESPALAVCRALLGRGCRVSYHDPYVSEWTVDGVGIDRVVALETLKERFELVIVLQNHSAYSTLDLNAEQVLVLDTRGVHSGARVEKL